MQELTHLEEFQKINKAFPQIGEKSLLKIISAVTLFISVAAQDQKITNEELAYLKRYTRYFFNEDRVIIEKIVKYLVMSFKESNHYRSQLKYCMKYVVENFIQSEKEEFVSTLLVIARSDLDISKKEKNFIIKICKKLDMPTEFFTSEMIKASLILARKHIDETINDLNQNRDEFKEYDIMSAKEYATHLNNPK